jgi:hypothetical protein
MVDIPRRKLLVPALAVAGASLLPKRANADTAFANFAFRTTGAPTARTMPDRLAETKNVLDYGADPTGSADSTSAIQAAVNWTSGANRGTIYFPLGAYKVTAPITFNYNGNLSICFRGEVGTFIFGNFNGYIFDRHLPTANNTTGGRVFERLSISNGHATGGGIRLGSTIGGAIRDCQLNAFICLTTEDAVGVSSKNINIENCSFSNDGGPGAHYIIIGGGGSIQGCTLSGTDTAVRAYGSGLHIAGCRSERCNTSFLLGLDSGGNNAGLSGFSMLSTTTEGCWTGYDLAGLCDGFVMSGLGALGHDSGNSGVIPNIHGSQYGLRIRADCARNGIIQCLTVGGDFQSVAGFAIEGATSRANVVIREVSALANNGGGSNWVLPSNAYTAKFVNNNVSPVWKYSQLPTGGDVLEGDEFDISDSTTATWGANVTVGGGANRVRVRYNGTNWTVVGK